MLEKFESPTPEVATEQWPYFSGTPTSKDFLAAKKFAEQHIATGKFSGGLDDTAENIETMSAYLISLGKRLGPSTSVDAIIEELRNANVIAHIPKEKKQKIEKASEFLKTEYVSIERPKQIALDEEQLQILEANLLSEEVEKHSVFKDKGELEIIHQKCLELRSGQIESEHYYYEFSNAGLIKGGVEEVQNDLAALAQRKKDFALKEVADQAGREKLEHAKKIASITESALAYAITELKWYGDDISVEQVSEFDDVKRGVDDILEIRKEDDESSFMGLGIDVTFRGLYSDQFKHKFFTLLRSIQEGHKTKVKYFKNHKGELMKEFAVPKMVLYFNVSDVKEMVSVFKKDTALAEHNSQRENILKQIMQSCTILSNFAEESQNSIFRRYIAVMNSIKELAWKNETVKEILEGESSDDVSRQLKHLVEEFKRTNTAA